MPHLPTVLLPARLGVFSPGIRRIPHLRAFLDSARLVMRPDLAPQTVDAVLGWGHKPTAARARAFAKKAGVPYLALEDGFLRSLLPGVMGAPPLGIVVDDLGIHYDATQTSRLERLVAELELDPPSRARARRGLEILRRLQLSKYNHQPPFDLGPRDGRRRILVVDQTAGDLSITLGGCATDFPGMLARTLEEHPDAEVIVKTHPDVLAGKKHGHALCHPRVRLVTQPAHPPSLFAQVDRVVAMTSLVGFEALVHGLPVTCFGAPWYAGWGLTDDRGHVPDRRGRPRDLETLFAAAYLHYARYVHPETGAPAPFEAIAEWLGLQRELGEVTRGTLVCVGFSRWKRAFLPAFLRGPDTRIRFANGVRQTRALLDETPDAKLVAWGTKGDGALARLANERGVPLWRMEDGFLRSVGLGSDLHTPSSLVLDRRGLYYDPSTPSELEELLSHAELHDDELVRARLLRERLVSTGLSKYNLGRTTRLPIPPGRRVALVVGQVEGDASIRRGCLDVRTNLALLTAAREASPDAFLVWRPHPDVISGNREGAVSDDDVRRLADLAVPEARIADCLDAADEIHTMTSLVGFEALLREKVVHVYGRPFYAGWGLTVDRHPHPRRCRTRSLDEMVACALLRYPRYVSGVTGRLTTPERVVAELLAARTNVGSIQGSRGGRLLRKAKNLALSLKA